MRTAKPLISVALLLALVACNAQDDAPAPTAASNPAAAPDAPAPPAPAPAPAPTTSPAPTAATPAAAGAATASIVRELTSGDRACYVRFEDADGTEREAMADFDICERTELLGKRVIATLQVGNVAAESCQGDPECTQSEVVELISDLQVVE